MSDEWIEGRALRGRGAAPPESEPEPSGPPGEAYPPDFVPRFLTTTGELKPLSDEVIAEIDALLEAHARGETPGGFEPQYQAPDGEMVLLTRQAFEELVAYARRRSWRRTRAREAPLAEPPAWQTGVGEVPPIAEQAAPPAPEEYVPWFDTGHGGLPPVIAGEDEEGVPHEAAAPEAAAPEAAAPEAAHTPRQSDEPSQVGERLLLRRKPRRRPVQIGAADEVVDAEWVVEVGQRLRLKQRWDEIGPLTSQILQAIRDRRWGTREVLVLLGIVAMVALAFFVPPRLAPFVEAARPRDWLPTFRAEGTPERAGGPGANATPTPTATLAPTLAPYQQGRIAFAASPEGNFDIYVMTLATGETARLTDHPASDRAPAWSPDGTRLVFVSDRAGDDNLFVMDADGSNVVQLTTGPELDHTPAWSPDGGRVVFSRETVSGSDLFAFDVGCMTEPGACEAAAEPLTSERYDLYPAWSPDGERIAFAAADFPGLPSALAVLEPGSSFTPLTGTGSSDFDPDWAPDGSYLAFVSYNFGDYDLWLVTADDSGLSQVTQDTASDVQPVWSPDGTVLVFASDRSLEGDFDLYAIRAGCALGFETPEAGAGGEGEDSGTPGPSACEREMIPLTDNDYDDLDPAWTR